MLALTRLEPDRYILLVVFALVLSNAAFYFLSVLSSEGEKEKKKSNTLEGSYHLENCQSLFFHIHLSSSTVVVVVALLSYDSPQRLIAVLYPYANYAIPSDIA